jgi:hypothetical protein
MTIHLQLAAILKRFVLGGWDWVHFLCFFKLFSDLTIFFQDPFINSGTNEKLYFTILFLPMVM